MVGDDNPASVEVSVLGSDLLVANVNSDGSYRLNNLGKGTWTLKFSTSLPGYAITYLSAKSTASASVKMDTVAMNYVAIPPVSGLKAVYDTISGAVHLTWSIPTGVKGIRDVEIFRVNNADTGNPTLVGTSDSTGYSDTIYPPNSDYNQPPFTPTTWLYNVAIRTESSSVGKVAYTTVATIDPKVIMPTFVLRYLIRDSARLPTDTIGLILTLTDPNSGLQKVSWLAPGLDSITRGATVKGRSSVDTLLLPLHALDTTKLSTPVSIAVTDSLGHHFTFQSVANDSLYRFARYLSMQAVSFDSAGRGDSLNPVDTISTRIDSTGMKDSTAKDSLVSRQEVIGSALAVRWTDFNIRSDRGTLWARLEAFPIRDEEYRLG
jgi:hypothetical protein